MARAVDIFGADPAEPLRVGPGRRARRRDGRRTESVAVAVVSPAEVA